METKTKSNKSLIIAVILLAVLAVGLITSGILEVNLLFDISGKQGTGGKEIRLELWANETSLEQGECTDLRWDSSGGTLYLEGREQKASGRTRVCPEEDTTYRAELENPPNNPLDVKTVQITVRSAAEASADESAESTDEDTEGDPGGGEIIFEFRADTTSLSPGDCTILHWDTAGGNTFLNGQGQPGEGEQEVCPAQTEEYQLIMEYPEDNVLGMDTITIEVLGEAASPASSSSSSGGNDAFQADVAVTDIYPSKLPYGAFHLRITNNGPGTLKKAKVSVTCTSNQTNKKDGQVSFGGEDQFTVKLSL